MMQRLIILLLLLLLVLPTVAQATPLLTLATQYENIYQIGYSPDGAILTTSSFTYDDNDVLFSSIQLWDAASGELRTNLSDNTTQFLSFAYSPDGTRLVTGTSDGQVMVWEVANRQILLSAPAHDYPPDVLFAPNGQFVATSDDSNIILWNAVDLAPLWILQNPTPDLPLLQALIHPDSTQVVGVYAPGVMHVWNTATGEFIKTLDTGYTLEPYTAIYVPDGSALALAYNTLELWSLVHNAKLGELASAIPVYDVAFTSDNTRAMLADENGTLTLWDLASSTPLQTLAEGTGFVWDMAFAPDNTRLAVAQNAGVVAVYGF
jgi:WD40 repeat protein